MVWIVPLHHLDQVEGVLQARTPLILFQGKQDLRSKSLIRAGDDELTILVNPALLAILPSLIPFIDYAKLYPAHSPSCSKQ